MYQNAQQNQTDDNQSASNAKGEKDGEVKDADYEVVDEEKK